MKIIDKEITIQELRKMAQETFGNMVKAVVDVKQRGRCQVLTFDTSDKGEQVVRSCLLPLTD